MTETATLALSDFLLARIAEDEAVAHAAGSTPADWVVVVDEYVAPLHSLAAAHIARHDPARVLAECAAKRRVVERHRPSDERNRWCAYCAGTDHAEYPCETSRILTLPYADHPDYRQEWKP